MLILFDVGNTHTHLGLADRDQVRQCADMPTAAWSKGDAAAVIRKFVGRAPLTGAALCSVVPRATPRARQLARQWKLPFLELTPSTVWGIGINYPKPESIGPDRLANAIAVHHHYGAPALVVDFGTAVTF